MAYGRNCKYSDAFSLLKFIIDKFQRLLILIYKVVYQFGNLNLKGRSENFQENRKTSLLFVKNFFRIKNKSQKIWSYK